MQDLAYLALSLALFALTWGLAKVFARYEERSR
jgi:hypothetical protein